MDLQDFAYPPYLLARSRRQHLLAIQDHARAISRQLGNTSYKQIPIAKPFSEIPIWHDPVKQPHVSDFTSSHGSRFEVDTNSFTVDPDHLSHGYKPPQTTRSSHPKPIDWIPINTDSVNIKPENLYQLDDDDHPLRIPGIQSNNFTIQGHIDAIERHAQSVLDLESDPEIIPPSGCGTIMALIVGIILLAALFNQSHPEQPQNLQEQGYLIDIPELIQFA